MLRSSLLPRHRLFLTCAVAGGLAARACAADADAPAARRTPSGNAPAAQRLLHQAMQGAANAAAVSEPLERADIRNAPVKPEPKPSDAPRTRYLPPAENAPAPDVVPAPAATRRAVTPAPTPAPFPLPASPVRSFPPAVAPTPAANGAVQVEDPRTAVPGEKVDPSAYEATSLTVSRVFVAPGDEGDGREARKTSMNVPVYYESRLLGLDKEHQRSAARLLERLTDFQARLATFRKEGAELLQEWNAVVNAGVPRELLAADSPSLVENQGADGVNRRGTVPGFQAGQNVSVQLKTADQGGDE